MPPSGSRVSTPSSSSAFPELDSPPYTELLFAPGITLNTLIAVRVIGAFASRSCETVVCVELLFTSTTGDSPTTFTLSARPLTVIVNGTSSVDPTVTANVSLLVVLKPASSADTT